MTERSAAQWPLVDEIGGARVAGRGGSIASPTGEDEEADGGGDVACGGGLEGGRGDRSSLQREMEEVLH